MKVVNCNVLSALDRNTTAGAQIDAGQLFSASFHAHFGDATAAGTLKLQASNDVCTYNNLNIFVATHWVDLPNQSASIVAGAQALLTIPQSSYKWLRAVYTSTGVGVQDITTIADQSALAQIEDITCVDDVSGSLNNTYFLLHSANNLHTYYVWYNVNGAGTDPALPGKIGIEVDIATDELAADIATISTGPIAAATGGVPFNANAAGPDLLIYNLQTGPCTDAADGAAPTGFAFAVAVKGQAAGTHLLNNEYFFINDSVADGATQYYAWFNVSGGGTDPALPGKTGIEVDINAGNNADDVATALGAAINGTPNLTTSVTNNVVTVTNASGGPYTPAHDFNTGFTFAVSGGGTTSINVNMNGFSI